MTRVRVLALGDSHFDARSRFAECIRVHAWIADLVEREGVDLVVHAGDVMERRSDPVERAAVAEWLQHVAELCPVLLVRGNHDALGDLPLFARLRTKHRVVVEEGAGVHRLAGLTVAALAWPRRAAMEEAWRLRHGRPPTTDEASAAAREGARMVLDAMARESPSLLVAHAMVSGSVTSSGQPLVGCDLELGLEDIAAARCPVVLGHIHKAQAWALDDDKLASERRHDRAVLYTGSPRRTAFGETEEKGVVLLDFEDGRLVKWERVATPCTPMWLVEGEAVRPELGGSGWDLQVREPEGFTARGAEIRLRYQTPAEARVAMRADAEEWRHMWTTDGAVDVKVEERVIPTSSARAPEVAVARTVEAKLRAMWAARGERMDESRVERLVRLVGEIETESAA